MISIPGVPPLLNGFLQQAAVQFLTADSVNLPPTLFGTQWGMYLNGSPAITFETFVAIDYRREWSICDYPIERGGFESFNKVQLPYNIHAKFAMGGSEADRSAMLKSINSASNSLTLYDIVTPEAVYQNVNVQHYDYRRTSTNGVGLLTVEVWLLEIRERVVEIASTSSGTSVSVSQDGSSTPVSPFDGGTTPIPFSETLNPSSASPYNAGSITAITGVQYNVLPVN